MTYSSQYARAWRWYMNLPNGLFRGTYTGKAASLYRPLYHNGHPILYNVLDLTGYGYVLVSELGTAGECVTPGTAVQVKLTKTVERYAEVVQRTYLTRLAILRKAP